MADSPKEAEAAQALFCAVVDYEGKKINPVPSDYTAFKEKYQRTMDRVKRKVKYPGVSLTRIETLLNANSNGWYNSSINIANKLFEETKRIARKTHNKIKPPGIELFYVRGGKVGSIVSQTVMKDIEKLFKHVKAEVVSRNRLENSNDLVFSDLNKWSPADIYLVSREGKKILALLANGKTISPGIKIGRTRITSRTSICSFSVFYAIMRRLIISGDLLPLSLKKAPNADDVKIKTINFIPGDVEKALEVNDVRYHGYVFAQTDDVFNSKDVYIKITASAHKLQFRDKGGTGGGVAPKHSYQMVITGGKEALDGSMGGASIGNVLYQVIPKLGRHFSGASQKNIISAANKISEDMHKEMERSGELNRSISNEICNKVYKYAKDYTNQPLGTKEEFFDNLYRHPNYGLTKTGIYVGKGNDRTFVSNEILRKRARAQFLFGKYMGGRMIDAIENSSKTIKDEIALSLTLYAGSRTRKSSPHFKASDISSF